MQGGYMILWGLGSGFKDVVRVRVSVRVRIWLEEVFVTMRIWLGLGLVLG